MAQTSSPGPDGHLALFAGRAERFTDILRGVGDAWDAPTPCEGWSVRDVVLHVVGTQRDFLSRQGLDAGPDPDPDDPAGAWDRQRDHLAAVLAQEGVAAREYDGYFGRTTIAATVADFYGWDLVVHGSDVARATGQAWTISDEEAAALHATADGWGEALHSDGVCARPVPVGAEASTTDRLLARLGRDPRWEPQPRAAS